MKDKAYLFVYSLTNLINGIIAHTPGPLIPFLAANSHVLPTSFYFIYISRSVGAIVGAILYKLYQYYSPVVNYHKILGVTSGIFFFILILF